MHTPTVHNFTKDLVSINERFSIVDRHKSFTFEL